MKKPTFILCGLFFLSSALPSQAEQWVSYQGQLVPQSWVNEIHSEKEAEREKLNKRQQKYLQYKLKRQYQQKNQMTPGEKVEKYLEYRKKRGMASLNSKKPPQRISPLNAILKGYEKKNGKQKFSEKKSPEMISKMETNASQELQKRATKAKMNYAESQSKSKSKKLTKPVKKVISKIENILVEEEKQKPTKIKTETQPVPAKKENKENLKPVHEKKSSMKAELDLSKNNMSFAEARVKYLAFKKVQEKRDSKVEKKVSPILTDVKKPLLAIDRMNRIRKLIESRNIKTVSSEKEQNETKKRFNSVLKKYLNK